MIIVADASTLILLEKVGLLEVIFKRHKIVIPKEIYKEAVIRGMENRHHDASELEKKIITRRISVVNVADNKLVVELIKDFGLAQGEAEAICLLKEGAGNVVAVDDLKAMKYCDKFNLHFTTTISLLLEAFEQKLVGKEVARQMLKNLAIYGRYKDEIIFYALEKLEGG